MNASDTLWSETDTARAAEVWADYQRTHDVRARVGQAVGVDPANGRVWFGNSAKEVALNLQAQGIQAPLFFFRVGEDYYARKGGRR